MPDCPKCGEVVGAEERICHYCNAPLDRKSEAEYEGREEGGKKEEEVLTRRHVIAVTGGVGLLASGWYVFLRDSDELFSGTFTESPGFATFVEDLKDGHEIELELELVEGSDAQATLSLFGQFHFLDAFADTEGESAETVGEIPPEQETIELQPEHEIQVIGEYDEVVVRVSYT